MLGCVLLLAVLLLVASEALAACAWVLWVEDTRLSDPKDGHWGTQTSSWSLVGASSSETECRRTLRETRERVTNPDNPPNDADVMYKECGTELAATVFGFSYRRAAPVQVILALVATSMGLLSWWIEGRIMWLVGAMAMFSVIPFTLIAIMPTNRQLLNPGLDRSSEATRQLLQKWGTLHAVRSILSLVVSCIFLSLVIRA